DDRASDPVSKNAAFEGRRFREAMIPNPVEAVRDHPVMKSLANEFFKQMQAGAEDYAAKNKDKFDFAAVGMKDERDFAAQVDAIENFITQNYNIIVVAPADSKAMVTPIAKALKAGIKVINIDVALDDEAKKKAGIDLAFFGPDNRAGAKLAGDALGKALGKGG
ncbi:MAG: sugar ABC transporter substrate-binding protein, partial [Mesorhizobium sp.]